MRSILLISLALLLASPKGHTQQALTFGDYGPIAFESFWRFTPIAFSGQWGIESFARWSADRSENRYFTQYFQVEAPLGNGNSLMLRTPYHWFNLTPAEQQRLGADQASGSSWGDIDIIFNIQVLRFLTNEWWKLYLSGEMHTAPTNRETRQFTDTLKMLGMLISQFKLLQSENQEFRAVMGLGGGGWQDDVIPRQNHIFKQSAQLSYRRLIASNWNSLTLGQTFLAGERDNDQGLLVGLTLASELKNLTVHTSLRSLRYTEGPRKVTRQIQIGARYNFQ